MKNYKPFILGMLIIFFILGCSILSEKTKQIINLKTVKNMETKADYTKILPFILKWEGGVSNHKSDTGGLTNRGITYLTYESVCKKVYSCEPSKEHFFNLSYDEVGLMVRHFWNVATNNNSIDSQKVSEAIFNWYWGSGTLGLKQFQRMLNEDYEVRLIVDGMIGPNTIKVINSIDEDDLFRDAIYHRYLTFQAICKNNPSQKVFLTGWLNRLSEFAKRHGENMSEIVNDRR